MSAAHKFLGAEPDYTIKDFEQGDIDAQSFDHEAQVDLAWPTRP